MKHLLQQCLLTAACILPSLTSLPALADASAPLPASPAMPTADTTGRATLLLLDDAALDGIDAAGFGASSFGIASADRGQAFSFSVAQLVGSRLVTVALSQSLALAIGMHPSATTGAAAGRF